MISQEDINNKIKKDAGDPNVSLYEFLMRYSNAIPELAKRILRMKDPWWKRLWHRMEK